MIISLYLVMFTVLVTRMVAIAQTDGISATDHQKPGGPIITPSLSEVVLQKGNNLTITCKGKGPLFLKQQDIPEEVVGSFKMNLRREQTTEADYESLALDLINVDQFAVGYYACFDNTVDGNVVLNDLVEEPNNTAHVSYIYVYVNGSDNLFAPLRENVFLGNKSKVIIGCKPTAPDINIKLIAQSNKARENYKFSPKIGFILTKIRSSSYKCEGRRGKEIRSKTIYFRNIPTPQPEIRGTNEYILGETFSINCSVLYPTDTVVQLQWKYPGENATGNVQYQSNEHISAYDLGELYKTIIITNATEENQGEYICKVKSMGDPIQKPFQKTLVKPYLNVTELDHSGIVETPQKTFAKSLTYFAYPPVSIWSLYRDGKKLHTEKYTLKDEEYQNNILDILLRRLEVNDTGNYTLFASNKECNKSMNIVDLRVKAKPIIRLFPNETVKIVVNKPFTLKAVITGYPLPSVDWEFSNNTSIKIIKESVKQETIYNKTVTLELSLTDSCTVTCIAKNYVSNTTSVTLLAYEYENGFAIIDENTWYPENQPFLKHCSASIYDFEDVFWSRGNDTELLFTKHKGNLSLDAELKIERISLDQGGEYTCTGVRTNGTKEERIINITVEGKQMPIIENNTEETQEKLPFEPVHFNCYAEGIPRPQIEWRKDDIILKNTSNISINTKNLSNTAVNSTVHINQVQDSEKGTYVCKASNEVADATKTFYLVLQDKTIYRSIIIGTVAVIVVLIVGVVYLLWKIRKEKQFKRELKAIGLYFFKNGVPKSINPDLFIDEQAELLPYDEKFEFPLDKLILGKQLGAGAFGVVYKAEARGIIDAEKTTTVAVKMVKKTADNMYIKALASELKIMVHLGKHVNIVNLLGACTKNIARRELIVIVEYCKFGNLHNYLLKHREVFIDQLTDSKENQFGKINRGYSCSSGNSGLQSDYFGSNQTQQTDHTFLNNTANTNRSSRKVSETGYVINCEPTYESDCSFLRALCTRDLLCWAFQIARGMEYLSSRKVLHGDLAARNILLAEDNIVKICDFGLSRSTYKNDEYLKKGDGLLPVKWLAIECMTDRIFSTQSDVWAFGIVMWELFSLAKTPYPNIRLENVMQFLVEGNRLEKPPHADDRLYEVMKSCWQQKPTSRPTFSQLQETLGSFLEDNVRNHYIDLNAMYIDMNKRAEGQEDYLAMVCAPDYNIMVAPSPHHYVNGDIAQKQMQHDSEGYLQMSPASAQNIFSPRLPGTKFDFDVKKMNPKMSGSNVHESELTPMLPLNRLTPLNGSESDVECNLPPSPHPCPRIDEESDEVFEMTHNNAKNIQSNSQTNPIYITFDDNCLDKKSQNNVNSYANLPNGFVS